MLAALALPVAVRGDPAPTAYTNLAGNVIAGMPVALTATTVTLDASAAGGNRAETLPLSIFPDSERRRLAADFGEPRVPVDIAKAVEGAKQAIRRSQKRAAAGLCSPEEAERNIASTQTALAHYLERALAAGRITPAEHQLLSAE